MSVDARFSSTWHDLQVIRFTVDCLMSASTAKKFSRYLQTLTWVTCRLFKGLLSVDQLSIINLLFLQVLSAATVVAKHTSALCNACRLASSKTANPVAKRHFVQSAKDVANSTASLVKAIKVKRFCFNICRFIQWQKTLIGNKHVPVCVCFRYIYMGMQCKVSLRCLGL